MPQFTGARRRLEALLTLTVSRLAPCSGGTPTLCFVGSPDGKIARSDAWVASAVENRRLGHYPDGISGPAGLVECYRSCPENLRLSEKAKSEVGPFDSTRNGNVVLCCIQEDTQVSPDSPVFLTARCTASQLRQGAFHGT